MDSKRGFKAATYRGVSQDHLLAAALLFLLSEGKQTSFENLVAEAFTSFPERFHLEGYPEWPNANVINKAWVRCRTDKKWIIGSASQGFTLTPLGEQIAQSVIRRLGYPEASISSKRKGSRQTISSRVVLRIEGSSAYKKYASNVPDSITEYDFCELLYGTLESTPEIISKNFAIVRQEVEAYGRPDLSEFLDFLKAKFPKRFVGKRIRGGLMPQRKEENE